MTEQDIALHRDQLEKMTEELDFLKTTNSSERLEYAARLMSSMEMVRHDLFGMMLLSKHGLIFSKEEEIGVRLQELYEGNQEMLDLIRTRNMHNEGSSPFSKLTPDYMGLHNENLYILDFAVSVNPRKVIEEKLKKYGPMRNYIDCNVEIYVADIANSQVVRGISGYHEPLLNDYLIDYDFELVEGTRRAVLEFRSTLTNSEKNSLDSLMSRLEGFESDPDKEFSFALNESEYKNFLEGRSGTTMMEVEKRLGRDWKTEIDLLIESTSLDSKDEDRKDLDEISTFEEKLDSFDLKMPKKPSYEILTKAYCEMERKSASHFDMMAKSKPLTTFSMAERSFKYSTSEQQANYQTLKAFSDLIQGIRLPTGDEAWGFLQSLKALFIFNKMDHKDFEVMTEIEGTFFENGSIGIKQESRDKVVKELKEKRRLRAERSNGNSEFDHADDFLEIHESYIDYLDKKNKKRDFNLDESGRMSFKSNGSVNMTGFKQTMKPFLDHLKVGLNDSKRDKRLGDEKVKSLPFWINSEVESSTLALFEREKDMARFFVRRGRIILREKDKAIEEILANPKDNVRDDKGNKIEMRQKRKKKKNKDYRQQLEKENNIWSRILDEYLSGETEDDCLTRIIDRMATRLTATLYRKYQVDERSEVGKQSDEDLLILHAFRETGSFRSLKELSSSQDCKAIINSGLCALMTGMLDYCREVETLAESITFLTRSAVKTMSIGMGLNSNQLVIVFPTDSVLSSGVQVPFISLSKVPYNELTKEFVEGSFVPDGDHQFLLYGDKEVLIVSKGKRLDMIRLNKLASMKEHFLSAFLSLQMIREKDGSADQVSISSLMRTFLMTYNISIGTSSLLDNIHWLVDAAMADYSFCDEYVEDKLMVACRNDFQMWLYGRTKNLLKTLNQRTSRMCFRGMTVDQGGYVDTTFSEQTNSSFPSILDEDWDFNQLFSLISECQVAYFSCPKALHEKTHNLISIHKTPIDIQRDIEEFLSNNENDERGSLRVSSKPGGRYQFDPNYIIKISDNINKNMHRTVSSLRDSIRKREQVDANPLHIKTMTSTRSVLINKDETTGADDNSSLKSRRISNINSMPLFDADDNLIIGHGIKIGRKTLSAIVSESALSSKRAREDKIDAKKMRRLISSKLKSAIVEEGKKLRVEDNLLIDLALRHGGDLDSAKINLKTGKVKTFRTEGDESDEKVPLRMDPFNSANYISSVVLTETLNDALYGEVEEYGKVTMGMKAKKSVLDDNLKFVFANRPKGQRTQADREIYILTKPFKDAMYIAEHIYKAVSSCIAAECISTPGDFKTLEIQRQAREMLTAQMRLTDKGKKSVLLHFNIDMTKWAPKDVLLKYSYMYASSCFLTKGEKRYLICLILKAMEKKMHVADQVLRSMEKSRLKGKQFDESKSIFHSCIKDADNGIWANLVDIQDTWLMGQWNYPSSIMHAGAMLEVKQSLERLYGQGRVFSQLNVHSDDNQCSFLIETDQEEQAVMSEIWKRMEYYTRLGCMEISRKKTNISKTIKQLVSQYNIGGVQKSLDVKQLMSSVSGLPWTSPNDDYSSIVSKLCSALCQGSLPDFVRPLMVSQFKHVGRVYGVVRKGVNLVAEQLEIPEHLLPMCLGGGYNVRMDLLALGGSKMIDKFTLYKLLKDHCQASSTNKPRKTPSNKEAMKALKLFLVCDTLSQETVIDVEDQMTHGINIFKPIRFQAKKNTWKDPFQKCYEDGIELEKLNEEFKKERPSMHIAKPRDALDCIRFYSVLYTNPSFRAALTSQNSNTLKLSKVCNRARGNYRFVSEASFQLYKLEHLFDTGKRVTLNGVDLANVLSRALDSLIDLDLTTLEYLWSKYIASDPELTSYLKVDESVVPIGSGLRPNPVAIRKPTFQSFFTIVNPISDILMYFFDETNYAKDGRKLRFPASLISDFENVATAFPAIIPVLEKLITEEPEKYKNYIKAKASLRDILKMELSRKNLDLQNSVFKNRQLMLRVLSDCGITLEECDSNEARERKLNALTNELRDLESQHEENLKKLNSLSCKKGGHVERLAKENLKRIDREKKRARYNIEQLSVTQALQEMRERNFERNLLELNLDVNLSYTSKVAILSNTNWIDNYISYLPQRLADMARQLNPGQKRVIFSAKENERDPADVLVSLKTLFSCRDGLCVKYLRSGMTYSKEISDKLMGRDKKSVEITRQACSSFYNLTLVLLRLGTSRKLLKKMICEAEYNGMTLNQVILNFSSLEHWRRKRLIYVCALLYNFKEYKEVFESTRDSKESWHIKQGTAEEKKNGKFGVTVLFPGSLFTLNGTGGKITKGRFRVLKSTTPSILLRQLLEFCKCLYPNRGSDSFPSLTEHVNIVKTHASGKFLYYNPIKGSLSFHPIEGYYRLEGMTFEVVQQINFPEITGVKISQGLTKVEFKRDETNEWELTANEGIMDTDMKKLKVNEKVFANNGLSLQRILSSGLWVTLVSRDMNKHTFADVCKCIVQRGRLLSEIQDANAYIASVVIHGDDDRLLFKAFKGGEEMMNKVAQLLKTGAQGDFKEAGGTLYAFYKIEQERKSRIRRIQEGEHSEPREFTLQDLNEMMQRRITGERKVLPSVKQFLGNTEDSYTLDLTGKDCSNLKTCLLVDKMEVSLKTLLWESKVKVLSAEEMVMINQTVKHAMYTNELLFENVSIRIRAPSDPQLGNEQRKIANIYRNAEGDPIPHGVFERLYSLVHPLIFYEWKNLQLKDLSRCFDKFSIHKANMKDNLKTFSDPELALALSYLTHFTDRNYKKLKSEFLETEDDINVEIERDIRGEGQDAAEGPDDLKRLEDYKWRNRERGYAVTCAKVMSKRLRRDYSRKEHKLSEIDIQQILMSKLLEGGPMETYTSESESETELRPSYSQIATTAPRALKIKTLEVTNRPREVGRSVNEGQEEATTLTMRIPKSRRVPLISSNQTSRTLEDERTALRVQEDLAAMENQRQEGTISLVERTRNITSSIIGFVMESLRED
uniref:RNA-directed RNA polymerase L n=1 Tax=Soybean thrips bunya-like virus 1 TaxID=2802228 RepID=A0A7T8G236_9VIRU|nr:RNA-dependent RNA polymerase [Soybean thrips bunya-like virus 1]